MGANITNEVISHIYYPVEMTVPTHAIVYIFNFLLTKIRLGTQIALGNSVKQ